MRDFWGCGVFWGGLVISFFVTAGTLACPPQQSILDFVFQLILAGYIVFVLRFKKGFGATADGYLVDYSSSYAGAETAYSSFSSNARA